MAVYDSLPPEATSGRKAKMPKQVKEQTPRQLLAKATTVRKRKESTYRTQRTSPVSDLSEGNTKKELAEKKTKGFENNAKKIAAKQGIPIESARAILAAGARKVSPAAKKANPALNKVKGKAKK